MKRTIWTSLFKQDYKRVKKQGKDIALLREAVELIFSGELLPEKAYHDHPLSGKWKGCRELHIEPDWLLIYRIDGDDLILERTGSHSELFGK